VHLQLVSVPLDQRTERRVITRPDNRHLVVRSLPVRRLLHASHDENAYRKSSLPATLRRSTWPGRRAARPASHKTISESFFILSRHGAARRRAPPGIDATPARRAARVQLAALEAGTGVRDVVLIKERGSRGLCG
jgi:hypothetical protein